MTIRVLLVDDEQWIRMGIALVLQHQPDIDVVGQAADGGQAVQLAAALAPDVVLMDVRMPGMDGVEATRRLTRDGPVGTGVPVVKVLVLTSFSEDEVLFGALQAGASGFLLKSTGPDELGASVRAVAAGDRWLDPSVTGRVLDELARLLPRGPRGRPELSEVLTPRELEVLALAAKGMLPPEVADHLVISLATVKTHLARILMKTGCRDRAQAVALAWQSGLMLDDPRGA